MDVASNWNTYVAAHIFTDDAIQMAVKAGVKTIEHGNLIKKKGTLQMMKDNGVWLSAQPILDDEDALLLKRRIEMNQKDTKSTTKDNPYATKDNPYATKDNPLATQYNPYATGKDYSKIPQRLHKYPSSDKAKKIVHDSITMDTLFSGTWPEQWSSPEAPEFHDQMDRCIATGVKVMASMPLS